MNVDKENINNLLKKTNETKYKDLCKIFIHFLF
jgi:hypothetical protein